MKKFIVLCLLLVFLMGCEKQNESQIQEKLVLGLMPSEDTIPLIIAKENGYFDELNIDVSFEVFRSAKDRDAALQSGALDGIIGDQVAVALYQNAGFDLKILSSTDCDFYLIANKDSGITKLEDLLGKSVAISENTVIEYSIDKMLEMKQVNADQIIKTVIPAIPARVEMLRNNKVDAALLPEPFASLAIMDGGILIEKTSDLEISPTVLAFTSDALKAKEDLIIKLFEAYDKSVDYVNETDISEYEDVVISTIGFPENMKGQILLPTYNKYTLPSIQDLESAIDWIEKKGLKNLEFGSADMIYELK